MKFLSLIIAFFLAQICVWGQSLPSAGLVLHYDAQDIDGDGDYVDQPSNGAIISTWTNQSSSGDATAPVGNEPTFNANGININGAVSFDGIDDRFSIANSTDLNTEAQTDAISLAIVLETGSSVAGDQIIYEQGGGARGYSFVIQNNHIYAGIWNNIEWDTDHQYKSVDLGVVSPNTIYFITIVQSSSSGSDATNTLSIYLNGSLASSVNHVDPQRAHSGAIGLGRINGGTVLPANNVTGNTGNTNYFQGMIGEFAIWKNALTQSQINDLNSYLLNRWSIKTPPTLDLNGFSANGQDYQTQFSEGSIPVNIANSGSADISDVESVYLSNVEFKIANLLDGSAEILNVNGTDIDLSTNAVNLIPANNGLPKLRGTITSGVGADAGKQILLLEAINSSNVFVNLSIADAKTILRNITYENQSNSLTVGIRTLEITATDSDNKKSASVTSEIEVIVGAPVVDLNGVSASGGNYATSYINLTTEQIADVNLAVSAGTNLNSLELFLEVKDVNLENFNISGTAVDISSNGVTFINATPNLNVTVSEIITGLNAGKQSVLIEPVSSITANEMEMLIQSITYEHLVGNFSSNDRVIGVVIEDVNGLSSPQVNTTLDIASPPINSVPSSRTTEANTPLSIPDISIADEDGDLNTVRLVAVSGGDLDVTISGTAVLSGNNIDTLIITGNELDINASLNSLFYTSVITTGTEILEVASTDLLGAQDIDETTISISPPPLSGLVLHYDAQDIDGDGDLTDQPSDGAIISSWVDKSTSSTDNASSSGGNEPTFNVNGINANGAVSFDGVNDLLTIANSTELNEETITDEISLAIVLETGASVAGDQIIYEQGGGLRGYSFVIQNNHIYAGIWNNTEWDTDHQYKSVDLGVVSPNTIYFITIVQNSSSGVDATNRLSIYLNGSLASSVNHVDPQRAHGGAIGLGRINGGTVLPANNVSANTGNTDYFQGMIGEFMIWKNALSQSEITALNTYFINRWSLKTPPTLDLNGLASNGQDFQTQYSEGSNPINIANSGAASIVDAESENLNKLTFKISNLLDGTDEILNISGTDIVLSSNGVTMIPANAGLPKLQSTISAGSGVDAGKQVLVLEALDAGNAVTNLPIADAQLILRGITYTNLSVSVSSGIREVEITATDTDLKESAVVISEIDVIVGAPIVDLDGSISGGANYTTTYVNLTTEDISAADATISTTNNLVSLELFLAIQDLNLEYFNISGTAIDISSNGVTFINSSTNLNVTVSEIVTGLNAGKQSVLIEPVVSMAAGDMETLLRSITYEHIAGTFSTGDRVIGVVVEDVNGLSSSQVNTTLEAIDGYEWTGATSTDWSIASNWNNNVVPPAGADIIIPNTANQPVLDQNRAVGNVTLTNAAVNLDRFILDVQGNMNCTSSSVIGGGLAFVGASTRQEVTISGTFDVDNITVNNSFGVEVLSGALNLVNTLTLVSGDLYTNNLVTLISNATRTARIAEITGGSIVGNITMQRFWSKNDNGYIHIASCINSQTLQSWNDDIVTTGFPGSQYPTQSFNNLQTYNETSLGDLDQGWIGATNITNIVTPGTGYLAYVLAGPRTLDVTGQVHTGDIDFGVSYTNDPSQNQSEDGWNLIGNPYPSSINWDAAGWTKVNMNNAIYIYDDENDQYASYVGGVGTNGGSPNIASSQSFWVQSNATSPQLAINESCKSASDAVFFREVVPRLLQMEVEGVNGYKDQAVVRLDSSSTLGFDAAKDAVKFASWSAVVPNISTFDSVGSELSINSFNKSVNGNSIPLKITVGVSGTYELTFTSNSLSEQLVYLEDTEEQIITNLQNTSTYSFSIDDTYTDTRFILHIGKAPTSVLPIELAYFSAELIEEEVNIEWSTFSEKNNEFYVVERSANGQDFEPIHQRKGAGNNSEQLYYNHIDENPLLGVNYYRLQQIDYDGEYTYSDIVSVNNVSNQLHKADPQLRVWPSPNNGSELNLVFSEFIPNEIIDITIVDLMGRVIYAESVLADNNGVFSGLFVPKNRLARGTYSVSGRSNLGNATTKIVVQ